ncbi:oligosaccharide flippase family protein [Paraconexibacter sp.]|uniref:oligosaccharide flippase family protein n=1 Tax=Paraconexibacter sp. TaxID=2949640 RepID=UPI0035673CEC
MPDAVEPAEVPDVLDTAAAGGIVVRGGAIRVGGFVAGTIVSLAGVVLLTRHLGTGDYGRYQTVVSFVAIVQALTDAGMAALGVREYTQRSGPERDRLMRVILGLRIALTGSGVLLAGVLVALLDYPTEMIVGVVLMGIALVFGLLQATVQIPLAAELRLGRITALDFTRQALSAAAIVVLVLGGAGLVPLFASTIPVQVLILVWTVVLVRGRIPLRPTFSAVAWRELLRPAIAVALATTVGIVYLYTAQIITSLVGTAEETGLFAASFRVFILAAAVPGILVTSAFPVLARAARDDPRRLAGAVRGLFEGTLLLGGAAAVACILGAGPIIAVIGGSDYADAAAVLRIQGGVLMLTFVMSTLGFTLLALHRHRALGGANLAALLVVCVATPLLVRTAGAEGAAWATLLGELCLGAGYLIALGDRPELQPRPVAILRVLVAGGAGCAAVLIPGLGEELQTVVGLLVFAAVAVLVRAVPPGVTAQLPGPLSRLPSSA